MNVEREQVVREIDDAVLEHRHRTSLAFHLDALSRQLVQRLPLVLDGRVHGWNLLELAAKRLERRIHAGAVDAFDACRGDHFAIGIAAVGGDAKAHAGEVSLVGIEQELREPGGSAEAQRQDARGERVKAAGVAHLAGAKQPLHPLHRLVRGDARGLVERQHAMHVAAARAPTHGDLPPPSVRCGVGRRSTLSG